MASVMESIDVQVPVRTAYNQWTQFESFPQFMEGVKEVQQRDDTHLHWVATIGGQTEEWDAEITEQTPDERVAWKSMSGAPNAGVVTFHRLDANKTRVTLQMEWEPRGATQQAGAALGFDDRQIKGDLERFKAFTEGRGEATGAWRGTVEQDATS
ncbi:MAG TPA: SRPBCC family protein [Chloroflexota bacterium]|nr:SRPBCC family protein [Chloroflexota bacterium]